MAKMSFKCGEGWGGGGGGAGGGCVTVLGSQGIVVKCTATIFFCTVDFSPGEGEEVLGKFSYSGGRDRGF